MTLKRLMIVLAVLVVLAGVGIMWLWQYAYTPEGRARVIIAQLKNDTTSLRGWMLQHHVIRPGFVVTPEVSHCLLNGQLNHFIQDARDAAASNEMAKLGPEAQPVVIEALNDDNRDVLIMALCVCRPDPIAIKPLIKCLRNHFDDFWRSAGNMHGNLGNLHGINNDIQDLCLDSLVEIGPEASGPLIQLLEDSEWDVRSLAAQGLGRLKDKRATEVLIRHLKERDGDVAYRAAKALGEIGDRKAIPALLVALKDDQLDVFARIPAAGALARMGRGEGLKFLQTMLKSRGPNIRGEAADELGTSDNKGALEPLLSLLSDPQYDVSNHAMGALIDLHDPRAVPTLRKFLSDSDARIRHDAAWVLGEIGDPKDIPALRELAKDPDPGVRSSAADAIEKLGAKPSPASQPGKT